MNTKNIKTELQNAPLDKKAGIKLIKLTGDENISVYAAEIAPKTKLNPHFHSHGIETYQIFKGNGIMKIGKRTNNNTVEWIESINVQEGDCFCISEGSVHQLINASLETLQAIFLCPESHLGKDRFFIQANDI
jgi:mannose-6-phosphate isomerase-like protein (cupin superfamily)